MDFELSDDQLALVDGVSALCAGRFDIEAVRAMADRPGAVDRSAWSELADTGVFSLALAEADGGVGLGIADAALVFEQLGRHLVPGPTVASFLAAGLVDGAADGSAVVGTIERTGGPALVEHAAAIDRLVIVDADGLWLASAADLNAAPVEFPLDPLTPVGRVADLPRGERIGDTAAAERWRLVGGILTSAVQLGLAGASTDLAVAYAREREQFGKPIGAFQAVKHLCADMAGRLEVCRAAVYFAAVVVDDPTVGDPARAAAAARILAIEASSQNAKDCVQVHGGMGYTWEVDAHLHLKRAWVLATVFGSIDEHAETMAGYV